MANKYNESSATALKGLKTYQSLVFTEDQMKTRISPISQAVAEICNTVNAGNQKSSTTDLTQNELSIFKKILTRDIDKSKYQVIREIAMGGMGNIYYVYDEDIRRHTVIKTIRPDYKDDPDIIKRFIFEARITGELEHPNIIPLHDFGFFPGYGIYFSMTYLHGESLFDIIQKLKDRNADYCAKYNLFKLLGIFRKVCDAVAFAHSKHIIHRDIKPENIMVGRFGEVILMDWGLAKRLINKTSEKKSRRKKEKDIADKFASPRATELGQIKGTPVYLSPEQSEGDSAMVDASTDIFLLGATLYHMFTYTAPYAAENVADAVDRARQVDYLAPEKVADGHENLPDELWSIINHAMAAEKENRYASVEELISDLDDLIQGKMQFRQQEFEKGESLLREGEVGTSCYIILRGKVDVIKNIGGQTVVLETLTVGDIVGEMALITAEPRTATVIATEKTDTVVLNKDIFLKNLHTLHPWMEKSITALARRLKITSAKLTDSTIINRNR